MEETPVLESTPELETGIEETTLDNSTESVETGAETTEETTAESGTETSETPKTTEPVKDEPAIAGTKLSAAAKATLDEIRSKNPKLAAELKSALFEREALKTAIPGGVNAVKELTQKLETLGGFEGIEQLRSEASDWEALDARFTAGDPAFIEEIATASPESFAKLAPAAFAKYAEVSPDGFSKYVAGIFQNDMHQAGLFNTLDRLADFLPADQPRVKELWAQVTNYLTKINQLATQQVKPIAAKEAPKNDTLSVDRHKFEAERDTFKREQWTTAANQPRVSIFNEAWVKNTAGLKLSAEQAAAAKELYGIRIQQALKAIPDFQKNAEAYYKAGNQAGYLRYMESVYKEQIPKAIASVLAQFGPAKKPGPKPNQAATPQKVQPITQNTGFLFVAQRPTAAQIDWTKTDRAMYSQGKVVLVGGKKVQFKR